jgi:polygalacturonase
MIRNLYVHDCVFDNTGVGIRFKTRRPRGGGGENLTYERIRMNLTGTAFNWDMLGSAQYVGELAQRLPAREVNRLTPAYRNIVARDILVERASQFVKVTGIPESPLTNVLIENVDVTSKKMFAAADVKGFTVRNATIRSEDPLVSLVDARDVTFDNVRWSVPGDELTAKISGDLSDHIGFKNCVPAMPKDWRAATWTK